MAVDGPVVLVGMMATGKTTAGRALAAALHRRFFDSDEMIESRTGHTVAELWEAGGEAGFRSLETEVLDDALNATPPGVVAAAGGVVIDAGNRDRLRRVSSNGGLVIWLRASPARLARRVHAGDHRPLLHADPSADPSGTLRRLSDERKAWYAEVADRMIDVDDLAPDDVVAAVMDTMQAVPS